MTDDRAGLELVRAGWRNLQQQLPLAAWASWQHALRHESGSEAAHQAIDLLQHSDRLPAIARGPHRFRTPRDDAARTRWNREFGGRSLEDVRHAAAAFELLCDLDPDDDAARHNLALCLAWQGDNVASIDQLETLVRRAAAYEQRREHAIESWMLSEILRQGAGAEALADDVSCTLEIAWDEDSEDAESWFAERVPVVSVAVAGEGESEAGVEMFEWLDRALPDESETPAGDALPKVVASVLQRDGRLRAMAPSISSIARVESQLTEWLGDSCEVLDRRSTPLPIELMDLSAWRFRLPDDLDAERRIALSRQSIEHFYTHEWIEQPRIGLAETKGGPPLAPAAIAALTSETGAVTRIKLEAIVRVREQLLRRPGSVRLHGGMSLDTLRRRVGLEAMDTHDN